MGGAIAWLAGRRRGCVTRRQLLDLGVGPGAIQHRLRTGSLIKVYPGVYAVGRLSVTSEDRAAAAVLACGPKAVLSLRSALCLWGWAKPLAAPFHVTTSSRRRVSGIHRGARAPLTAVGNRVIRIAGAQLVHEPLWLAAQLAGALVGGAPEWVRTLD